MKTPPPAPPITGADLDLVNHMWETAKGIRRGGQEAQPFAFIGYAEGGGNIIPLQFDKEHWPLIMRLAANRPNVTVAGFVSEAYAKRAVGDAEFVAMHTAVDAGLTIKEMDGRVELLQLVAETVDGAKTLLHVEINPDGTLGEESAPDALQAGGRMSGFFPPPTPGGH